jgi:succinate dehydrogenase/fumarate reductase flavoprotein subunit
MMMEFFRELQTPDGPVYLKLNHLAEETILEIERVLHGTERPSRGRFHEGRGLDYRNRMVEMHISEIGLCSGHSASGVWVNQRGETTVPGLYAAGDMASVPHNYLLGAMTYGKICAENALRYITTVGDAALDDAQIEAERARVYRPTKQPHGLPHHQVEYKIRRMVNDYLQPPKSAARLGLALRQFERAHDDLNAIGADNPHDLMRAMEGHFIRDCAEMAARASLERTESRWGLYHYRVDHPEMDNERWFVHLQLKKDARGVMTFVKRPVAPYIVPLDEDEMFAYHRLRIPAAAEAR